MNFINSIKPTSFKLSKTAGYLATLWWAILFIFQPALPADRYTVKKAKRVIKVDGKATEKGWKTAEVLTDFRFPWKQIPTPPTEFRALWDEQYIYFMFKVEDSDVVIGQDSVKEKAALGSDRVELFFTQDDSLNQYFTMEIDPANQIFDASGQHYRQVHSEWNWPGLEAKGAISSDGYTVEGRIPVTSFQELGLWRIFDEKRGLSVGVFRAEFSRLDDGKTDKKWISWIQPKTPKPDFHTPSAFGKMGAGRVR